MTTRRPLSNTRDGLRPSAWGPRLWSLFFATAWYWEQYRQPISKARHTRLMRWISFYLIHLYCKACRDSFNEYHLELNPPSPGDNSGSVVTYLFNLKNRVNAKLGKPLLRRYELRRVCCLDHDDMRCWVEKGEASMYYWECFWINVYCIAFNYPPKIDVTVERDRKVQKSVLSLLRGMTGVAIPSPGLYDLTRMALPSTAFRSRAEIVQFVYDWELSSQISPSSPPRSLFGRTLRSVIHHFEDIYRSRS